MKIYNTGIEVFEFTHGGITCTVLPKFGTFKRISEPYTIQISSSRGQSRDTIRHRDKWIKESDEGINSNFIEAAKEICDKGISIAVAQGLDYIKSETVVLKAEIDKVAAMEKKVAAKTAELSEKEKEINVKLATLKKVEDEAVSRAASKHQR